jgi:hypothetical protein
MCLILDINIVHLVFPQPARDYMPIHKAITDRRARLVYGGHLLREYKQMGKFLHLLYRLDQQGTARKVNDNTVDLETQNLVGSGLCVSNDLHIIALARISGARLLCTDDGNLKKDFKNPALVSNPRGKIYQRQTHADLIRTSCKHVQTASRKR